MTTEAARRPDVSDEVKVIEFIGVEVEDSSGLAKAFSSRVKRAGGEPLKKARGDKNRNFRIPYGDEGFKLATKILAHGGKYKKGRASVIVRSVVSGDWKCRWDINEGACDLSVEEFSEKAGVARSEIDVELVEEALLYIGKNRKTAEGLIASLDKVNLMIVAVKSYALTDDVSTELLQSVLDDLDGERKRIETSIESLIKGADMLKDMLEKAGLEL